MRTSHLTRTDPTSTSEGAAHEGAAPEVPSPAVGEGFAARGYGLVALLSVGHALSDFYATLLSPILVELGRTYTLGKAQVQMLPALTAVFGSVFQPAMGVVGDRVGRRWLIVSGTACAALFMCSIGFATNLTGAIVVLILGSAGVSAFHPNSASLATSTPARRGLSFATFLTGGAIGLAVAPLVVTQVVARTGNLRSLLWLCLPGVVFAVVLAFRLSSAGGGVAEDSRPNWGELIGRQSGVLWLLFVVVTLRSTAFTSSNSFMGHLCEERGWSITQRGVALSAFLACGAVGGMLGGWLSDAMNRKVLLVASSLAAGLLSGGFALSPDFGRALLLLMPAGIALNLATPMLVVIAQELCPSNRSAASGMMMGLAWGVAGVALPLIGKAAELPAIQTSGALAGVALLTALAGLLSLLLPSIERTGGEQLPTPR